MVKQFSFDVQDGDVTNFVDDIERGYMKIGLNKIGMVCLYLLVGVIMMQCAARSQATTERRFISGAAKTFQAPFSDGVLVGQTLYLSGHLGLDPKTGKAPDSLNDEIHLVLDGIRKTLTDGSMTMDDLVFVQIFCTDLSLYGAFNTIYRTYFVKDFPARAFLGTASLLRGCHFEMQGIAVKR